MAGQIPEWADQVGPGWQPLLRRLHGQLAARVPNYTVGQLGEKWGGLRVYLDHPPADHPAWDDVAAAMADSLTTCEYCGAPGRARRHGDRPTGWVKTVCEACHPNRAPGGHIRARSDV